jgi:hypothetical protein
MVPMIGIRRDEPNSLRTSTAPIRVAANRKLRVFQRLDGNMDIPDQAQSREDELASRAET